MNAPRDHWQETTKAPDLGEMAKERFGVSEAIVKLVGWYMAIPEAVRQRFGPYRHGLMLPFMDIHGLPSIDQKTGKSYERVRLCNWEGPGKYRSDFGSGIHAYLTPGVDWAAAARNPKMPLLHTEGEGKATRSNTCDGKWPRTIGLTGVDCLFNRNGSIAYELAPFNHKGRETYVAYDAPMKKEVRDSLHRTALRLLQRGAIVFLLSIDDTPTYKNAKPGSKMGLDDYINAGGTWEELKKTAIKFDALRDEDRELNPLLTSIAMISSDSGLLYVHIEDNLCGIIRKKASMEEYYANVTIMAVNPNGKLVRVKAFPAWLGNKQRMELGRVVIRPDLPPQSITPDGNWNSWRGFATMPKRNDMLARKFRKFLVLFFSSPSKKRPGLRTMTKDGRRHMREFLLWMAHLFQYPAERRTASFNFVGPEGVGKSVLLELPAFIIGLESGGKILDAEALETQWTTWADGTIYACINEPANKSKAVANKLKAMRTNPKLQINNKYGACYDVENLLTIGFSSNEFFTTAISEQARRDWVWAPEWNTADPYRGRKWGSEICAEIGKLAAESEEFRAAVLWELLYGVDLEGYNPRADAGNSKAKTRAAASSLGDLEAEKVDAWKHIQTAVEDSGIVIFTPGDWGTWMELHNYRVVKKAPLQTYLTAKAEEAGWFSSGHAVKMRIAGGKPRNIWYVAKKLFSEYDKDEKHAGLVFGTELKGDKEEWEEG